MSGGLILHDPRDEQIADLKEENGNLRAAVVRANQEAAQAKQDADRALGALRRQLTPLFRSLQAVFGELDTAGVSDDAPTASGGNPKTAAVWEAWKQKLSPACGQVIDALLIHGELNVQQICVAARMGKNTVYGVIVMLKKAGVINKNGGRFNLKALG